MENQKGYVIQFVLVIFAIIVGLLLFPPKFPSPAKQNCTIGDAPSSLEIIQNLPAIHNQFVPPAGGSAVIVENGGPDQELKTDYVLIRKNVPVALKVLNLSPRTGATFPGLDRTYAGHTGGHMLFVGEFPEHPGYDLYYPGEWGEFDMKEVTDGYISLRKEGMLISIPRSEEQRTDELSNTFYLSDIYQDRKIYDKPDKEYKNEDLFRCNSDTASIAPIVVNPNQRVSPDKAQLQLQWFLFRNNIWALHCKPAVYLYPEKKQLVSVKVFPKGELNYTDPPYDLEKGWTVTAFPSGNLEVQSSKFKVQNYPYLYYESRLLDSEIDKPKKGWSIKGGDIEIFLEKVLPELGLNNKEKKDFKDYWLSKLPKSPYYFVGLIDKHQRDYLEELAVSPNPETSIRFSLYFEMKDSPVNVEQPTIQTPMRKGFTLVDWGGMIKLHPGTPFTCSQ